MPAKSSESDRRSNDRHTIELKVEYKRLNTFFADYTKNISKGGTFIGTDKPLDIGTEFVFALSIPQLAEPVRLAGRVVWITSQEQATEESPPGMGIRFQYANDQQRRDTEGIVEKLMTSELGEHLSTKLLGRKPHD